MPETRVADTRRSRRVARRRIRSRVVAFVLAPALALGAVGAGALTVTSASAAALPAPTAGIALRDTGGAHGDADAKPFILAGEDAVLDVSLTNSAPADGFNIAFSLALPEGIAFVSSGLGTPVRYGPGETLPNSAKTPPAAAVPAGMQLWVFEDVADLPGGATYDASIIVRPDAAVFPVGASPDFAVAGHVSSAAPLRPMFDGSTGVGGAEALRHSSSGTDVQSVPVQALRLTKHEPSPEEELLRGVHDNHTTYTVTIENTPQGTTDDVVVVDYLPAGLEFLVCADTDNTQASPLLYDGVGALGGTREYPGAGPITSTAPADCVQPVRVETVDSDLPAGLPAGVYTKVTWELPALSGATAQAFPDTAGTPGVTTLRYRAAVPLFENTMTFTTAVGDATPDAQTVAQAANLNNNTGASTRHGLGSRHDDGRQFRNAATVSGTYTSATPASAPVPASDSDTERIIAMDLRILKSVATSAGTDFVTGELATFTLDLATSEYAGADRMRITDVLPNGLCPALPASTAVLTGDPWPGHCAHPSTAPGAQVTGADVAGISYDQGLGEFTVTFEPDPDALAAKQTHQIVYTALMRPSYTDHHPFVGSTTSGDRLVNEVEIEGVTLSIDALDGVASVAGAPAFGEQDVWDDSSASLGSQFSAIGKRVLARDAVIETAPAAPTAATACPVDATNAAWADDVTGPTHVPFVPGDVVCYELTVRFANQLDVRNARVTDFLPAGVAYVDSAVAAGTTPGLEVSAPSRDGQRVDWRVGTEGADGARFVPLGSTLVLHVLGAVTSWTPNDAADLDKPANLMKYRQENVHGDVFFLRDEAVIATGRGPALIKGVHSVDGDPRRTARTQRDGDGDTFASNRDGIHVRQGEIVRYRIDLTGGTNAVTDLHVWDALPPGVRAVDVDVDVDVDPSWAHGTVLDPGAPGYPTSLPAALADRSVIVWDGIGLAAGAERTLMYEITVPDGTLVNTTLPNTAAIPRYDLPLNTGGTATVYPTGSLDETPRDPVVTVPGAGTRDDSAVHTPPAAVRKDLVGSEISPATADRDPADGPADVVQGEIMTFSYAVTVPAGTSVRDGVLADRGTLTPGAVPFIVTGGSWAASALTGATASDFTFAETPPAGTQRGVLTFPTTYTNSSAVDQVFTVTLTGYVGDAGANGTTLSNRASFTSASWNGTDDARVTYREPAPEIDKTASKTTDVSSSDVITYTLTVGNASGRVHSYDNVVTDTVPAGLRVDVAGITPQPVSVDAGVSTGVGGDIVWHLATLSPTATITYSARIDPSTGAGGAFTNVADVHGYTLPATLAPDADDRRGERAADDDATVTAVTADLAKGVRIAGTTAAFAESASAPIGQTVEYEIVATLHADINYYGARIQDDLPAGAQLIESSISGPAVAPLALPGAWTRTHDAATNTWTWAYGDIPSAGVDRTLTLRYRVLLSDDIANSIASLPNTAALSWTTAAGDESTRTPVDDTATVTVLDPRPAITKTVDDTTPAPGQRFTYTLEVTNAGATPGYRLIVTDTVPDGVVVDPASISTGGALSGATATGGGVITWDAADLPGPLHPSASSASPTAITLTYDAVLAASATIGDDDEFENTARVTSVESFPDGGRALTPADVQDTAIVDPAFPHVVLHKTAANGTTAYAGEPFAWTLTLRNTGDGDATTIAVTDVLPQHWSYDMGSATIRVGTDAPRALADPSVAAAGDVQTLVWNAAAISAAAPALPGTASGAYEAARTIVIGFTATPAVAALTAAGATTDAGVRVPHTNTLSATTTDPTGATGNADGPYTAADDTADAYLHAADLRLDKVAGPGLVAGAAPAVAWTITVRNTGPDTAVGPFTVTDEWGTLPDGFTVTGVAGDGWTCDAPTAVGVTCTRSDATETLAKDAAFPALSITAAAASSFDLADAPVSNSATVTARTFDPDADDNTDSAEVPVTASADLAVGKTGPATPPNAGDALTWTITVTNSGPSDSVSTTAKPITVADTIPAGIEGVVLGALPAGWSANTAAALDAGDELTLTLADGARLVSGAAVTFTLTGTVSPSLAPGTTIANTATVTPGATDDPVLANNTSTTTTMPATDTTIGVSKTRQVLEGGTWRDATADDAPVAGAPVSYLVAVANTGTADARGVSVTDAVADYLTYASFVSVEGSWTRTSTTATAGDDQAFALAGALVPGATAALRLTFDLAAGHTGDVVNAVVAGAENAPDASDDDGHGAARFANLSIAKTHTGDAVAGESMPYTLTVTNHGPSDASGPLVVTDTLPAGFAYAAGSATVRVDGGAAAALEPTARDGVLTWTIGTAASTFAVGSTVTVAFTADVDADVTAGTYTNVATVDGPHDTDPSDDVAHDPTIVTTSADLSVVKTAAAGSHVAGTDVAFTLRVTNAGPSVARDVAVIDAVPSGMTVTALSGAGFTCDVASATCVRAILPVGTFDIAVTARVASAVADATDLTNTVTVTSSTPDPDGPATDDETVRVNALADLALTKTAVDDALVPRTTADAGATVRYLLEVTNEGASDAVGPLRITDTLPAGMTFIAVADGGAAWTCAADAGAPRLVECVHAGGLPAGAHASALVIHVSLDPGMPTGPAVNVASVSSATPDPEPANDTDDALVEVTHATDLSITKTHDPASVRIGDALTFGLVVRNDGPSVATGIEVVDTLPAGLEYLDAGATAPEWSVTAVPAADGTTVLTAALATALAPGASAPVLEVAARVHAAAYPAVVNVAQVSGAQPDRDPSDNIAEDPVDVPAQAALVLEKLAHGAFEVGGTGSYTLTLTNRGPTEDPGPVVITDDLPAGLDVRGVTGHGMTCADASGTVTCTVNGPLAVGASATARVSVAIGVAAFPEVVNTAVVDSPTEQTPDARLSASATTSVSAQPLPATGGTPSLWLGATALLLALAGAALLIVRRRGAVRRA
ncbi:isopeptide-forming domain-containing fimbrial protein [Microbacterium sp. zg.Y1084]|uniref:isopeptide-forming domain-containing fimbrial protein n=1 Tax=Microbacterium sp. zg.Y1084 TaxID=2969667 RepID=UPI00214A91F4|nr:isopeptide-forming domain-containing fimbrial protein [Microbacterium sp. zg.Y1084]MCR2812351.1 isopeptide-forming domain-containing fimbrial protein [Microbacterium sp. zg.Y1084]